MPIADPIDSPIRLAAFERLRWLRAVHAGAIPWSAIDQGFHVGGQEIRFASAAEGIFKPVQLSALLSIKTVVPKPKGRVWYSDQVQPDEQVRSRSEVMSYAFKGQRRLTIVLGMPSRRAAAVKLPASTTRANTTISLRSSICIQNWDDVFQL
jgi:hypothetical protein